MGGAEDAARKQALARVGSVLGGKWRLDALLGLGGGAAVYRATHRNGRFGAVKVLHRELAVDRSLVERFLREGYAANRVGHPGAVAVLDDDSTPDGTHYLVMELLLGESLEVVLAREGPRDERFVLDVADRVLPVLAAAHDKGIVHRDIKPENLFLTRAGVLKVLDFGIARVRERMEGGLGTSHELVMGTPAYMPPEQARGRWNEVDGTADLWGLAASMLTLMTGRLLREAETASEDLLLAMTVPIAPAATLVPGLSADVAAIVDRALAFDKTGRFPDARAMHAAVQAALRARGVLPGAAPFLLAGAGATAWLDPAPHREAASPAVATPAAEAWGTSTASAPPVTWPSGAPPVPSGAGHDTMADEAEPPTARFHAEDDAAPTAKEGPWTRWLSMHGRRGAWIAAAAASVVVAALGVSRWATSTTDAVPLAPASLVDEPAADGRRVGATATAAAGDPSSPSAGASDEADPVAMNGTEPPPSVDVEGLATVKIGPGSAAPSGADGGVMRAPSSGAGAPTQPSRRAPAARSGVSAVPYGAVPYGSPRAPSGAGPSRSPTSPSVPASGATIPEDPLSRRR